MSEDKLAVSSDQKLHSIAELPTEVTDFLLCRTPEQWVSEAIKQQDVLLIDHSNCEKKAAGTALNLMFRYDDNTDLLHKMSRLAREELRHFEQVLALMVKRGVNYRRLSASRYAGLLHASVRNHEPAKLVDTLIVGAFIEARSCERFHALAPWLDNDLQGFYLSLLKSESRHFKDYLALAEVAQGGSVDDRVCFFANIEREAIESDDSEFRFHSGVPVLEKTNQI
ncbi:MAG: tRNA isopentenyl-2-thiomethyl-A-37 hydroxylase MiaE [Candidatus Endonucleobacter sp. (ex Gigantidas childressi)]|nr:tRNA isopentenyl-2-thiomethyl-A-37 hydroxylase MiaE [Candidatus Endonucleobacter sp. (ex Gigantidas childressi)]